MYIYRLSATPLSLLKNYSSISIKWNLLKISQINYGPLSFELCTSFVLQKKEKKKKQKLRVVEHVSEQQTIFKRILSQWNEYEILSFLFEDCNEYFT